jgi:very-short-patch-repair endonuclease
MERMLYKVLIEGGLPKPSKQFQVLRSGIVFAQPDCEYPRWKIAIEADSYRWHGTRSDWERDRARDRVLRSMGWIVLRFSWEEIYLHPEFVLSEVDKAITVAKAANS